MAKTISTMIPLGTHAPDFKLLNTITNEFATLKQLASPSATVIMFICNHCPFVKLIQDKMAEIAANYNKKGVSFIAICSNDVTNYPEDSPENMRKVAEQHHYTFPYLYDETQEVAKAYHAACTPDFFVFDKNLACVYRGRFDEATPGNGQPVTGKDLSTALDQLLAGKAISEEQHPSMGCNIKWKS